MDIENIAGEAEAKWYGLDGQLLDIEAHPERAGFLIKNLTPGRTRELRNQARQFVWTGQRTVPVVDEDTLHKLMLHDCVLGWRKLDREGKPFEHNRKNLEWLDFHSAHFNQLWQALATRENTRKDGVAETDGTPPKDAQEVEGELGNSPSGGATTSPTATDCGPSSASPASVESSKSTGSDATGSSRGTTGSAP